MRARYERERNHEGLTGRREYLRRKCVTQIPQIKSVHDWYENETMRLLRSIEIRVEVNKAKLLATKDKFGRTPLHYAAASGASEALIKALLSYGSANLNGQGLGKHCRKALPRAQ